MITAWIAGYAAVVGTGSLIVALLAFRAAGPRTRLRAAAIEVNSKRGQPSQQLALSVQNRGRLATTIEIFGFSYVAGSGFGPQTDERAGVRRFRKTTRLLEWSGPDLPHRLDASDAQTWTTDLERVLWDLGHPIRGAQKARILVRVGHRPRSVRVTTWRSRTTFIPGRRPRGARQTPPSAQD